jgi:hypothetical protein
VTTYSDGNRSTLSASLYGQTVRLTEVGTPVSTTNRNNADLSDDDGGANGSSDFL